MADITHICLIVPEWIDLWQLHVAAILTQSISNNTPWHFDGKCGAQVYTAFSNPEIQMLVVIRKDSSAICVYVPPCSKIRTEQEFSGRTCVVAHTLDKTLTVSPMHIVTGGNSLWLSDRDPPSFTLGTSDILRVELDPIRCQFKRDHMGSRFLDLLQYPSKSHRMVFLIIFSKQKTKLRTLVIQEYKEILAEKK